MTRVFITLLVLSTLQFLSFGQRVTAPRNHAVFESANNYLGLKMARGFERIRYQAALLGLFQQ